MSSIRTKLKNIKNIFWAFELGFYSFLYSYNFYVFPFHGVPHFLDVLRRDFLGGGGVNNFFDQCIYFFYYILSV